MSDPNYGSPSQNNSPSTAKWVLVSIVLTALLVGGVAYLLNQKLVQSIESNKAIVSNLQEHADSLEDILRDTELIGYDNLSAGYSVMYPNTYFLVDNSEDLRHELKFLHGDNGFAVQVEPESDSKLYMGEVAQETIELNGGITANLYSGINESARPYVAVVASANEQRYVLHFYEVTEIEGVNQKILASFKLL